MTQIYLRDGFYYEAIPYFNEIEGVIEYLGVESDDVIGGNYLPAELVPAEEMIEAAKVYKFQLCLVLCVNDRIVGTFLLYDGIPEA